MRININEIFGPTIQGEGLRTGCPTMFVRLNGCNLRCVFAGGSICDTPYTSHHAEKGEMYEADELAHKLIDIYNEQQLTDLIITGGEPMLQRLPLEITLKVFKQAHPHVKVTVETNGSIIPTPELFDLVDLWSVSPKLANSGCFDGTDVPDRERKMHHKNRFNPIALAGIANGGREVQFKFVYTNDETEAMVKEVLEETKKLTTYHDLERVSVLIMPEGQTLEQINRSTEQALPACYRNGWRFCDRLHIRIWGDKRGV